MRHLRAFQPVLAAAAAAAAAIIVLAAGPARPAGAQPVPQPLNAAPAGPAQLIQPTARKAGIFVPRPKGAGETLDETAGAAAAEKTDSATTVQGDRINGNIVAAEAGGKLRLAGPQFDGEVQVLVSTLDTIALKSDQKETGADEVLLTNGDRIVGEVAAITPEAVLIETQAAGRLKIVMRVVRSVSLSQASASVIESNFASGTLEPWVSRGGSWSIAEDTLVCRNRGGGNALYAKLEQKEAVTMVAKVQATEGTPMRCEMVVFADTAEGGPNEGRYGRNSLFAMFYDYEYYLNCVREGNTNTIVNRSFGRQVQQGTLRLAYDPGTGKARLWLDSADLGQYDVPNKPAGGQYVIFNSQYPLRVQYLAVLRGIVPPSGEELGSGGPAADETIIEFANKDRVSVTAVALADGQLACTTSYGELKSPVNSVGRVLFGKKGREEPRRQNGDVRVRTAAGRMTFQFERLTADSLVGRSDYLGEVTLKRSAVREIKFNIYR